MAKNVVAECVAAVALCALSGCGTFNNVTGHDGPLPLGRGAGRPYHGVIDDLTCFGRAYSEGDAGHSHTGILLVPYFMLIDAPLSPVGDYIRQLNSRPLSPDDLPATAAK
jgi:hypothetical protein